MLWCTCYAFVFVFVYRVLLQWRILFEFMLPWVMLDQFTHSLVEIAAVAEVKAAPGVVAVKAKAASTVTVDVPPGQRQSIFRLFNLLGAAIQLVFVRDSYWVGIQRAQNLLQNYNILFNALFPSDCKPNQHFAMHVEGTHLQQAFCVRTVLINTFQLSFRSR